MAIESVREIMTANPDCCTLQDTVASVARRMASGNFGSVPVVDPQSRRLQGIITDRDIVCRIVARDRESGRTTAREAMSPDVATLGADASIHDCVRLMERRQVRRVPIVDDRGMVVGIVAQADLARATAREQELEHELAEMVEEVSEPQHVLSSR